MTNAVIYSVSEGIADIVLTRPPVNALDLATVREIIAALRRAAADTEVGAVVISSGTPRQPPSVPPDMASDTIHFDPAQPCACCATCSTPRPGRRSLPTCWR